MEQEQTNTIPELQVSLETPLVIVSNFPQLRAWLDTELAKYEIEVTAETLSEAKQAMAELNSLAKKLDQARIEYAKQFKAPITAWEAEAKTLFDATKAAREKIAAQAKRFDDEARALCASLMCELLEAEYARLEVRAEYAKGADMIQTLVGISYVTKTKQLTKAARENIEGLAAQGRAAQDKADGRLARFEADCRAAGVEPLTIEHVRSFIDADDKVFQVRKAEMIQIEVKRLAAQREKIRKEEEDKARAKAEAEERERKRKEAEEADRKLREEQAACKETQAELEPPPIMTPTVETMTVSAPAAERIPVAESPAANEGEKVTITFEYRFAVHVSAKASADPEKVKKFLAGTILVAIKTSDERIIGVDVQ